MISIDENASYFIARQSCNNSVRWTLFMVSREILVVYNLPSFMGSNESCSYLSKG
jgi:hypothetical protein